MDPRIELAPAVELGDLMSKFILVFVGKLWAGTNVQFVGLLCLIASQIVRLVNCGILLSIDYEFRILEFPQYFAKGVLLLAWRIVGAVAPVLRFLVSVFLLFNLPLNFLFRLGKAYNSNEFSWEPLQGLDVIWHWQLPSFVFDADEDREREYYHSNNVLVNWWRVLLGVGSGSRAVYRYLQVSKTDEQLLNIPFFLVLIEEILLIFAGVMVADNVQAIAAKVSFLFSFLHGIFITGYFFESFE